MNKHDAQVITSMMGTIENQHAAHIERVNQDSDKMIKEIRENWNQRYMSLREEVIDLCHHVMNTSYAGDELKKIAMNTADRLGITIVIEEDSKGPEKPEDLS